MDANNLVIKLWREGSHVELTHRLGNGGMLYPRARELHTDKQDACLAAQYLVRFQDTHEDTLGWNQIALRHTKTVNEERGKEFIPFFLFESGKFA